MWSCQCALMFFLMTMTNSVEANDESFRKKILDDMPKKSDFEFYLTALEKIVNFYKSHKIYVDLNIAFGLFLIDADLKEIFEQKPMGFPKSIRFRLGSLFQKSNELTEFFQNMIPSVIADRSKDQSIMFAQLFQNRTTWPGTSNEFNAELLTQSTFHTLENLQKMYGQWDTYFQYVTDFNKFQSSLKESDDCITHLATHGDKSTSIPSCQVPENCNELVYKGSQYGYGLTRRILFMIVARFSRQCVVNSAETDKIVTDRYCLMAFNEAEYIAANVFQLPDLMLEQISFCGLLGHAQFLRNTWLKSLLLYQTPQGCFSERLADGRFDEKRMQEKNTDKWELNHEYNIMNGQCNGHLTAVAATALTGALRYIMETYYN